MTGTRQFDTDAVLDRAVDLFWARGYAATGMQEITEALGIGRGSIYAAFGSKHGLYRAALERYVRVNGTAARAALEGVPDVRQSVRTMLVGRLEVAAAVADRRGCLLVNTITECLPADAALGGFVRDVLSANEDALAALIAAAVARGDLPPQSDPRALARFLVVVMDGLLVAVKATERVEDLIPVVDVAVAALAQPVPPA